jgi:hypothetical protein
MQSDSQTPDGKPDLRPFHLPLGSGRRRSRRAHLQQYMLVERSDRDPFMFPGLSHALTSPCGGRRTLRVELRLHATKARSLCP